MVGFSVILLCIFFVLVESQICTEWGRETYWKPYVRRQSYIETYRGWCWSGRCDKTRRAYRMVTEHQRDYRMVRIQKCCAGYIKDDSITSNLHCNPVCFPACKNSYCQNPGICSCNPGYKAEPNNSHNCLPVCDNCFHGTCTAPGVCNCKFGYKFKKGLCQPICSELCINGACIAPETCECLEGYRKSENNICEPYCSRGCVNGTCTEPEKCSCKTGWQHSNENKTACEPECNPKCINSTCVAPNTCTCHRGFVKTENNSCTPFCSKGCNHGTCERPENCICDSGWYSGEHDGDCLPQCDPSCINSTCTAPNTCDCLAGYAKVENHICSPFCSKGCNHGTCERPETCICDSGWYSGEHDGDCLPQCDPPCINSTCTAPNTCDCFAGYTKAENNICSPFCSTGCNHGTCIDPEICRCGPGWYAAEPNSKCLPRCKPECINATCTAPNTCDCFTGYTKTEATTCEPIYSKEYHNETCVESDNFNCSQESYNRQDEKKYVSSDNTEQSADEDVSTETNHETDFIRTTEIEESRSDADLLSSSEYNTESYNMLCSNDTSGCEEKQATTSSQLFWAYGVAGASAVLLFIVIALIIIKRKCSKYKIQDTLIDSEDSTMLRSMSTTATNSS